MSDTDFKKMTEEELERRIKSASGGSANYNAASWELQRRHFVKLSKPHWTLTPAFWVATAGTIVAALAAYFAYLAIPLEQRPFRVNQRYRAKSDIEQTRQSQSSESSPTKAKTSPSPIEPPNNRLDSDRQKTPTGQP